MGIADKPPSIMVPKLAYCEAWAAWDKNKAGQYQRYKRTSQRETQTHGGGERKEAETTPATTHWLDDADGGEEGNPQDVT